MNICQLEEDKSEDEMTIPEAASLIESEVDDWLSETKKMKDDLGGLIVNYNSQHSDQKQCMNDILLLLESS